MSINPPIIAPLADPTWLTVARTAEIMNGVTIIAVKIGEMRPGCSVVSETADCGVDGTTLILVGDINTLWLLTP
jgi:hypothetical protein